MSEETKGKKKVGKLIAGVVVIGAVLVAATNFKALANSAVKLFSSPAKYYQHVEMSAMEDAVSMLSELYGEQWKEMYRLSEDKGASYTYTIEIGKDIQELLEEYVDVDGEDFSEISVSMSSSTTEAAKKNSVSASLAVKDEKDLTGNLLLDAKDWLLYLQVPEVSKDYLLFDLEDLDVPTDMTDELMESFAAIYEKLPEEKEV